MSGSQHGDSAPMVHNPPLPRNPPRGRRRSRSGSRAHSSDDRPRPDGRHVEQDHYGGGETTTTPHGSAVLPPLGSPTPPRYGGYHGGYSYGPHGAPPPHLGHPLSDPAND